MPIDLICPGCSKNLRLPDEHAGKTGRCPECKATFPIPMAASAPLPSLDPIATTPFGVLPSAEPMNLEPPVPVRPPLFKEQAAGGPNPFASDVSSPYASSPNPYASAAPAAPNMYASPSGGTDGYAITSIVLGVISIITGLMSCCCLFAFISIPCGLIGLALAFQANPNQRTICLVLNGVGLLLSIGLFVGSIVLSLVGNAGNGNFN